MRLLKDIRERRDDYAAQLSSLTLASLSARKSSIDDTPQGIVASLFGGRGKAAPEESDQDELLWQARMVLKIAELLDQEEEEVAVQMAMLDDQQEDLIKMLQGDLEDEDEESLLDELQQIRRQMSRPTASAVASRLKAWARLYLAGEPTSRPLWLTHQTEAADILLEKYEKGTGHPAAVLGKLALPANIGWARQEAMDRITAFRKNSQPLLAELAEALQSGDPATFTECASSWSAALDAAFPAAHFGRSTLLFYRLDESSLARMVGGTTDDGHLMAVIHWEAEVQ